MTESYLGIVFLGIVGIVTAVLIIGLSQVIGHVRPSVVKGSPYESGMQPLGGTRERFSVNFYIVAMLALGLHMYHGLWSMLQSLGLSHPRYDALRRVFAAAFTLLVVAGNISIPVAVLTGVVHR